ncbi:MAG: hypothetical protein JW936_10270 [Sedimentisphaerales bacterium]|nr:hypothetical protein [Sedimentisphaerales bacterium]
MKTLIKIIIAAIVITVFEGVIGALTCGGMFNWVYQEEPTNVWKCPHSGVAADNCVCDHCTGLWRGADGSCGSGRGGYGSAVGGGCLKDPCDPCSVCAVGPRCGRGDGRYGNRSMASAPPITFLVGMLVLNFIFAMVYVILRKGIPGCCSVSKGIVFGLCVWLVGVLPGMFMTYMFMTVAVVVIKYWTISALIMTPIKGVLAAVICGGGDSTCCTGVKASTAPSEPALSAEAKADRSE